MVVQYMDLVEKDYFGLAIRNYPFATDKKKKDKDKQGVTSPEVTVDGQDFPPFVSGYHGNVRSRVLYKYRIYPYQEGYICMV